MGREDVWRKGRRAIKRDAPDNLMVESARQLSEMDQKIEKVKRKKPQVLERSEADGAEGGGKMIRYRPREKCASEGRQKMKGFKSARERLDQRETGRRTKRRRS